MEVMHSTNIVFNTKQSRNTTTGNGKGLYKKSRSPAESKTVNITKQGPGTNGGSTSPKRAESLESQMKSIQDSPICLTDTPKFYSPTKVGVPLPTMDAPRVEESPLFRRIHDLPGHPVLDTPLSWKNKDSPSDSGIEMTPVSVSPSKVNPKLRSMYNNSRREADESTDFSINPDPVPYQSSNFMSSTMMKKVPVARRHFDTFGTYDFMAGIAKRGMMLHTDRYQWDLAKALDGLSQRERLQAELEYMERLRGIKRRREVLPHRAQLDLLMGGKKVEFNERFEIQREIQKLKSLILPEHAKDLFHGRGFTLPGNHNSLKPRRPFDPNMDLADELSSPFSPDKYSINPETGRVQPKIRQYPVDQSSSLPKINSKGYLLGHGSPIILSKEKRTVESIKARLRIPTSSSSQAYMTRSKTNVTTGGPTKPTGIGGRSLTAQQAKKDPRHPVTAPTTKPAPVLQKPDITIPVSVREPDDPEDASPVLPKSTPATSKKPEVEETTDIPTGNDSRNDTSRLSAARSVTSPSKAPTPNPLKAVELVKTISEDEQARLKQTFNKLDTDKDGHIMFSQLQTQLPKQFSQAQEKYIKQVYDITSSNTFFGVDEFMTMSYLTNVVTNLSGEPRDAYNKLEFYGLNDVILKYVELFQTVDRNHRGKIALSSLQEILHTALSIDFKTEPPIWNKIVDTIETNEPMTITKIEFLAHIPYFQTLEKRK